MPVRVINKEFFDPNGVSMPNFKGNVGSKLSAEFTIGDIIRVFSLNNSWTFNYTTDTIIWNGGNWLAEGFRVGDTIEMTYFTSGGSGVYPPFSLVIGYISQTEMQFTTDIPHQLQYDEYMEIKSTNFREEFYFSYGFKENVNGGNDLSLIDGTRSLFYADVKNMAINDTISLVQQGYKSGNFGLTDVTCQRIADLNDERRYVVSVNEFIFSGILLEDQFTGNDCLKFLAQFEFVTKYGETDNHQFLKYDELGNSGWFNEAFNTDTPNSAMIQGITEVYYNAQTFATIKVTDLPNVRIGATYLSANDFYYKQKYNNQSELQMYCLIDGVIGNQNSEINPSGARYSLTINNVTSASGEKSIDLVITPNSQFIAMFNDNDIDGDRRFIVWAEVGNVNWILFDGQLEYLPIAGSPLTIVEEKTYMDHSENVQTPTNTNAEFNFNTEDDFAYFGKFLLEKGKVYENLIIEMIAKNTNTNDEFTLSSITYNFSGVQISNDGRYLLNEVKPVISTLPTTSEKRNSVFKLDTSIDSGNDYGVSIYFPCLLRWEYWLDQLNANVDFYPNQNKNWQQYSNFGDWETRLKITLVENGIGHEYSAPINILDYDSDPNVDTDFQLVIDATNQNVGAVTEGQLMRMIVTHTLNNGYGWNPLSTWGMITIEPKESAPRWIISSVYPIDGNLQNPLSPLNGTQMIMTFPTPEVARMECYFNPDLIDLKNGIKFTSKIKGCNELIDPNFKREEDGTIKLEEDGSIKLEE